MIAADAVERTRLAAQIASAARILAPAWPLRTFVAVNPLAGLEDRRFEDALAVAGEVLGARGTLDEPTFRQLHAAGRVTDDDLLDAVARRHPDALRAPAAVLAGRTVPATEVVLCDLLHGEPAPGPRRSLRTRAEREAPEVARSIDALAARWCAAYLDDGQAAWPMPERERGLYAAWRPLAARDRSLPATARAALAGLPDRADDAILDALDALGIGLAEWTSYLRAHLTAQPGWASHLRWRGEQDGRSELSDLLAIRLSYEAALLPEGHASPGRPDAPAPPVPDPAARAVRVATRLGRPDADAPALRRIAAILAAVPVERRALVWLDAYERHYRERLLARLATAPPSRPDSRAAAQLVCCIDTRSEGLRRRLEALGRYETLGFAGFFAVAMRYQDLAGGEPTALCPVLLDPRAAVRERPAAGAERQAERRLAGLQAVSGAKGAFHAAKQDAAAPFALAEASGWAAGAVSAARTFLSGPYGAARRRLEQTAAPPARTMLDVREAFPLAERALLAEVALTTMGLTRGFGRIVVLCGHGSRTENNPYAAALDCGACGGNAGGPSARAAAAILNEPDVRAQLTERGIDIPADTWFVAAEHETATDRVTLLDDHLVPGSHAAELERLAADLRRAGEELSVERAGELPGAPRHGTRSRLARHVRARGSDWAQVFPEWGLAGNAAFVVGPREMTRHLDLGRRCFLHSYDAAIDEDGSALETILTAPLVVAQWINCQYYFSTVDPVVFGAGSKTIHNVVGGFGVLAGHDGDLRLGLPWQSVADGERLVHEPMRLLAIVQAPIERIEAIVARNTVLQRLFDHGWVALAARERPGLPWLGRTPSGWRPWTDDKETRT